MVRGIILLGSDGTPISGAGELDEDSLVIFGEMGLGLKDLLEAVREGYLTFSPRIMNALLKLERSTGIRRIMIIGEDVSEGKWISPDKRYIIYTKKVENIPYYSILLLDEKDDERDLYEALINEINSERYQQNMRRSVIIDEGMVIIIDPDLLRRTIDELYKVLRRRS